MRTALALWVAGLAACSAPAAHRSDAWPRRAHEALTVERLFQRPSLTGTAPVAPTWSPDSTRLAFLWNDAAQPQRQIWIVDAGGAGAFQATSGDAGVRAFAWTPDGASLVFVRSGALWRVGRAGGETERLADAPGATDLAVSPDGRFVSFLREGDLWTYGLADKAAVRRTDLAVPSIAANAVGRYNRPDVEVGPYVWGGPSYAWSPDGRTVALHVVDRRDVRQVPFPDYLGGETAPNPVRRPYPGDANEHRSVRLLDLDSGASAALDLPAPTAFRVVDFSWSATGRLLIDRESDTAVERELYVVEAGSQTATRVWSHSRETRVYTLAGSAWHPDGAHVVFVADLDDRYGLYLWGPRLDAPQRLSDPSMDVLGAPRTAERSGAVYFEANAESPYERHVFRVSALGAEPQRVTRGAGQHRAFPSPDGARVALLSSDDATPTELYVAQAESDAPAVRVTDSPPPEFDARPWARVRYATFPSHVDGATIHARILEPKDLDRSKRHPVLFGPMYSNTVRNRFGGRYALIQQLLVERGYIVVQADIRGSTGYGRRFREAFLMDFAGQDLEDVESAARYMRSLPYVDGDRLGIWGSSYGGTLTVYALLKKPGLFRAGVAAAAAVDPRFFGSDDVAIVRRPQSHPAAFERGAAQYAANLEDALLLIHGMQDQVVPFKTAVSLADELMRQGKDFDFAFAPGATHGWLARPHEGRYLLARLVEHFDRHLGPRPGRGDR